jgi:hypothetical protein
MTDETYYHPISIAELDAMNIPDVEFVVEGILADQAAVLLSGREKSGKGFLIVDLACCVATERPFVGMPIRKPGAVLYMSLEESIRTLRQRFRRCLGSVIDAPIDILPLDGYTEERFQLENVIHLQALTDLIRARNYVLVIIDTLREAHTGRENDSDEMAPLVRRIRDIAHGLGVTILVTHHMNKSFGSSRGSTAILASFDDEIAFTRSEERSETTIRGELRAEGRNLAKYITSVAFEPETGRWQAANEPEMTPDPNLRTRILDALDNSGAWLTAQDLDVLIPGVALKTIQNKLSDMRAESPMPFAESGLPKKGSPRKYHSLAQHMDLGNVVDLRRQRGVHLAATGTEHFAGEVAF